MNRCYFERDVLVVNFSFVFFLQTKKKCKDKPVSPRGPPLFMKLIDLPQLRFVFFVFIF